MKNFIRIKKNRLIKKSRSKYLKPTSKPTVSTVKRIVNKAIRKEVETKQYTETQDTYFNSAIGSVGEMYNLIPALPSSYRDGNKLRMKYLNIKALLSYETAINTTNNLPIYVDIFVFQDKINRSSAVSANSINILNNSDNYASYDGTATTALLPFNTEQFTLVKKITKRLAFNWAPGATSTTITDPNLHLQSRFSLSLPVKGKNLIYEGSSSTLPMNTNYRYAVGFYQYTNTTQIGTPVRVQMTKTLYYTDA